MTDNLTPENRTRAMRAVHSYDTSLERGLARLLRAGGVNGWRRHYRLTGKPDFVFPKYRVTLFLDGCFWHGCPRCAKEPMTNREYWSLKIARNKRRDRLVARTLRGLGWTVVRIWEHSLSNSPGRILKRIEQRLERAEG